MKINQNEIKFSPKFTFDGMQLFSIRSVWMRGVAGPLKTAITISPPHISDAHYIFNDRQLLLNAGLSSSLGCYL